MSVCVCTKVTKLRDLKEPQVRLHTKLHGIICVHIIEGGGSSMGMVVSRYCK